MPIYEYRCSACGFQSEYLQKLSDPPLADCPECGKGRFSKMVTAAGFHLKGSGWYATDFKGGGSTKSATPGADGGGGGDTGKTDSGTKTEGAACGAGACSACS